MKLSVIIVNYNVRYFLEQALYAVRKAMQNVEGEVFVVDNNSVDDSVQMVQDKFPEVQLIANKDNPGFSIANNQAIRISKGEYVLLLNPDTVVEEDTFEKVVAFMDATPDAGGLGVKMIDGSGAFLPESKRGFPTPFVAFCKTVGLSRIFPNSKRFNQYHLGYLDKDETHKVEVLAGAFMLLRKSALDKIGLLDETFFMYGEDIDLSYRIIQGGYQNYYFADTTIIHYKGESTKKGSLNYVKAFYNAMIIFAKKHFKGEQARLYVFMLQLAIYFKASLTVITNFLKKAYLPLLDALLIFIGIFLLKDFWAIYFHDDPQMYPDYFIHFNIPLYIGIWLTSIYFSGGYDKPVHLVKLIRGVFVGTVLLAAVYGFLPLEYRTSRVLILLGALWTGVATVGIRSLLHFIRFRTFKLSSSNLKNFIIVGNPKESERVLNLIRAAEVYHNFIGTVSPTTTTDQKTFLGNLYQLDEIVHIYKIDEIIFCSQDVTAQYIMQWMTKLGASIEYKIVPEDSLSIIGSRSKNTPGELYTIDIQFNIVQTMHRRNKRVLDVFVSLISLLFLPVLIWLIQKKWGFIKNIFNVLFGKKTWVGYHKTNSQFANLPKIRANVLTPIHHLNIQNISPETIQRLNLLYAKDYSIYHDVEIIWKGRRYLGS